MSWSGTDGPAAPEYGGDGAAWPPRRSRAAIAALVLGVLSIPLALTVYLGVLAGLAGVIVGALALPRTRAGRATGRGMAVTGLVCAVIGLVVSIALGAYGLQTYRDCQDKLGHRPTAEELRECART